MYKLNLNFSKKFRDVREGPCLTKSGLESETAKILTRRIVLGLVAEIYGPQRFIIFFTWIQKLLMRETGESESSTNTTYSWDDELPDSLRDKW